MKGNEHLEISNIYIFIYIELIIGFQLLIYGPLLMHQTPEFRQTSGDFFINRYILFSMSDVSSLSRI